MNENQRVWLRLKQDPIARWQDLDEYTALGFSEKGEVIAVQIKNARAGSCQ